MSSSLLNNDAVKSKGAIEGTASWSTSGVARLYIWLAEGFRQTTWSTCVSRFINALFFCTGTEKYVFLVTLLLADTPATRSQHSINLGSVMGIFSILNGRYSYSLSRRMVDRIAPWTAGEICALSAAFWTSAGRWSIIADLVKFPAWFRPSTKNSDRQLRFDFRKPFGTPDKSILGTSLQWQRWFLSSYGVVIIVLTQFFSFQTRILLLLREIFPTWPVRWLNHFRLGLFYLEPPNAF